jgi:hypothetical protein
VLKLPGVILAHAFADDFFLVRSSRTLRVFRSPAAARFDPAPVANFPIDGPASGARTPIRIVSASLSGARCAGLRPRTIVAETGDDGQALLLGLDRGGKLELIQRIQLDGTERTWPLAGANNAGRFLLAGVPDQGVPRWGVASVLCTQIGLTESPIDSLGFPEELVEVTGEITPDGHYAVLKLAAMQHAHDLGVTQIFALETTAGLVVESHHILRGSESRLSLDGRGLLNLVRLPNNCILSLRILGDDGVSAAEPFSLAGVEAIESFVSPDEPVVFRSARGAFESYSAPSIPAGAFN